MSAALADVECAHAVQLCMPPLLRLQSPLPVRGICVGAPLPLLVRALAMQLCVQLMLHLQTQLRLQSDGRGLRIGATPANVARALATQRWMQLLLRLPLRLQPQLQMRQQTRHAFASPHPGNAMHARVHGVGAGASA
ncbi:hypothetical protein [Xanthomonas floridensis]|uniref:Uncharacterized protein n=1 Tax=Xanthomonas floridensis TaxID=1843580 RepID=A0A1A9MAR3_9XANT|nr:hypothetical protein [Xanthomonas floridensis]MEA5125396.1 hypothetical protein [Xanthomonas floridensis]MEA5133198.1 hypothetical protein [Xanthomonas floridensis]OAG67222.1 hypothetical protein A7D17_18675 [Xanthomonas floridensis]